MALATRLSLLLFALCFPLIASLQSNDLYRPQLHFSVKRDWLNDPNGLVYLNGEYHLYYQYTPGSPLPGLKSWAHSVSTNLVTWEDLPVAIEPDAVLGDIWSGCAVVDFSNSSGFQSNSEIPPVVAIFTQSGQAQTQSVAYSNDFGRTFTKYANNPVIPNPGKPDFRDPKVIYHNATSSWVLVMAAGDRVEFYSSADLTTWTLRSSFGTDPDQGLKGVWECPDFFPLEYSPTGQTLWVLLVSNGGGGPNGGSNTQYFVGNFNGTHFTSPQMDPLWMDTGVDNYASISFFNERRRVVIGWMTNLMYANDLPTGDWRGQMTLPRELRLSPDEFGSPKLTSHFVEELSAELLRSDQVHVIQEEVAIQPDEVLVLSESFDWTNSLLHLNLSFNVGGLGEGSSLSLCLVNELGQEVCTGYDEGRERPIFMDRERSGVTTFNPNFSRRLSGTRTLGATGANGILSLEAFVDVVAIEAFYDGGFTPMTMLFYPDAPYNILEVRHHSVGNLGSRLSLLPQSTITGLKSIYDIPKSQ